MDFVFENLLLYSDKNLKLGILNLIIVRRNLYDSFSKNANSLASHTSISLVKCLSQLASYYVYVACVTLCCILLSYGICP